MMTIESLVIKNGTETQGRCAVKSEGGNGEEGIDGPLLRV